jgi:AcrR family transcriptional regulator
MTRGYKLKRRAERLAETRRRIVEATVALHEEVGPARTTVTEIARRAGVSRPTVYSQFPDDRALFAACSAHFRELHPMPELTNVEIEDALARLYAHFTENEAMIGNIDRDAQLLPAVAALYGETLARLAQVADWHGERLASNDTATRAVMRLAFNFATWRTLARSGLEPLESALLVASLARSTAAR